MLPALVILRGTGCVAHFSNRIADLRFLFSNVEVCDATTVAQRTAAGYQKKILIPRANS